MTVRRIVANVATDRLEETARFYREVFDLDTLMDLGWIVTFGTQHPMTVQMSVMTEGGSNTPVPDISIEVDDLEQVLARAGERGHVAEYGPADEPWGVRRFFLRDPAGKLVNVLTHLQSASSSG